VYARWSGGVADYHPQAQVGCDSMHLADICRSVDNDSKAVSAAISAYFAAGGSAAFTEPQLLIRAPLLSPALPCPALLCPALSRT
jgi:hypothetical protein